MLLKRTGGYIFFFLLFPLSIATIYALHSYIIPALLPALANNIAANLAYVIIAFITILIVPYFTMKMFFSVARMRDKHERKIEAMDLVKDQQQLDEASVHQ